MDLFPPDLGEGSRMCLLLDRLVVIEDDREAHRVAYPLARICCWRYAKRSPIATTTMTSPIGASTTWGSCGGSCLLAWRPVGAVPDDRPHPGAAGAPGRGRRPEGAIVSGPVSSASAAAAGAQPVESVDGLRPPP